MDLRKSKYPLMAKVVDISPDHPFFGHGICCHRCGVRTLAMISGPYVVVGNNIEGVIGVLCHPCSEDYIRSYLPTEAIKYGLLFPDEVKERERRAKELHDHFVPITGEERITRREKNRIEGNLCIICESEPKKGFEGKYAKDLCEICYEYFSKAYIEGCFDSLEEFKESGIKPGRDFKNRLI